MHLRWLANGSLGANRWLALTKGFQGSNGLLTLVICTDQIELSRFHLSVSNNCFVEGH